MAKKIEENDANNKLNKKGLKKMIGGKKVLTCKRVGMFCIVSHVLFVMWPVYTRKWWRNSCKVTVLKIGMRIHICYCGIFKKKIRR